MSWKRCKEQSYVVFIRLTEPRRAWLLGVCGSYMIWYTSSLREATRVHAKVVIFRN